MANNFEPIQEENNQQQGGEQPPKKGGKPVKPQLNLLDIKQELPSVGEKPPVKKPALPKVPTKPLPQKGTKPVPAEDIISFFELEQAFRDVQAAEATETITSDPIGLPMGYSSMSLGVDPLQIQKEAQNERSKAEGKKAAVIAKFNRYIPKVEDMVLGANGENFINEDGSLWSEFSIKDNAGNENVRYAKILEKVDEIVRRKGGGGGLSVDYIATKVYAKAQAYQYQKLAAVKIKEKAKKEGIAFENDAPVAVTDKDLESKVLSIVAKAQSSMKATAEANEAAFEKELNPIRFDFEREINALYEFAPVSMQKIYEEIKSEEADKYTDASFEGKDIKRMTDAEMKAEAVKRFNIANRGYIQKNITPKVTQYGELVTNLQRKYMDISKRRQAEIKTSAEAEQRTFLETANAKNKSAFERYKQIVKESFNEVDKERGDNKFMKFISYHTPSGSGNLEAFYDQFVGDFGRLVKNVGAYMGAAGLPYSFTKKFQTWGSDVSQSYEGYKPTFSEGKFDPVYWAQSVGSFAATSLPAMSMVFATKNPYLLALAGNAYEGAAMGGERYLQGIERGEDPTTAAREGRFVFDTNTTMILFDALWAKGFMGMFDNAKTVGKKIAGATVGNIGQSTQETLQTTFEGGSTDLKSPFTKEGKDIFFETLGSGSIMSAFGIAGSSMMKSLSKSDVAPSVAAQVIAELNTKYGSQRGAAVAEILRMDGSIGDAEMAVIKENSELINGYIEDAKNLNLGEAETRAYAGIRFEIKQLENRAASISDDVARGVLEKQIKDKKAIAEKIATGEQKITTITVGGRQISVYEDKAQEIASGEGVQELVNQGIVQSPSLQTTKTEQNAVQEQETGSVPVQPEARVGQEVAQGKPEAEPQATAEQGRQKEVAVAKEDVDFVNELSNEDLIPEIDKAALTTDGAFDGGKVGEYLQFVAEQTRDVGEQSMLNKGYPKQLLDLAQSKFPAQKTEASTVKSASEMTDKELEEKRAEFERQFEPAPEEAPKRLAAAPKRAVQAVVNRLKRAFPNAPVSFSQQEFDDAVAKSPRARKAIDKGGRVYGLVSGGRVILNPAYANFNSPVHEFGHLWVSLTKQMNAALYDRGVELIRDSEYMKAVMDNPLYQGLSEEEMLEEALAKAIGDKGEQFIQEARKSSFKNWLKDLYKFLKQYTGIGEMSAEELEDISLDEFLGFANYQIFSGSPVEKFGTVTDKEGADSAIEEAYPDLTPDEVQMVSAQIFPTQNDMMQAEEMGVDEGLEFLNSNRRQIIEVKEGTAYASMFYAKDGTVYVASVINEVKGNKNATVLMDKIVAKADEMGITLTLVAMPFSYEKGLNMKQLVDWYGRKGFEITKEHIDKETGEIDSVFMRREPDQLQAEIEQHPLYPTMRNLAEVVAEQERRKGTPKEAVAKAVEDALRARLRGMSSSGMIKKGYAQLVAAAKQLAQEYAGVAAEKQKEQAKQEKLADLELRKIAGDAAALATQIQQENKAKKTGKTTKAQAKEKVLAFVKKQIDALYASGAQPKGLSWIQAMANADAIATDATEQAFPKRGKSVQDVETVTMSVRQFISNAVSNQIRAIKATRIRASAMAKMANLVIKLVGSKFGIRISLTTAEANRVVEEVLRGVYGNEVDADAIEATQPLLERIADKAVKRALLSKTKDLLDKLSASVSAAKFGGFDGGVAAKVMQLLAIDTDFWAKSDVTAEQLYDLNLFLTQMTKAIPNTANLDNAIDIASSVREIEAAEPTSEFDSLLNKMNRLIKQLEDGELNQKGRDELLSIQKKMEDIRQRSSDIQLSSQKDIDKLNEAYDKLTDMTRSLERQIARTEQEISDDAAAASNKLSDSLMDDAFRYSFPNSAVYKLYTRFVSMMSESYVRSKTPEWQEAFINIVDEMFRGNINRDMFKLMNEYTKEQLSAKMQTWATNTANRYRDSLKGKGLTGTANRFRSYMMDIFATKNAKVIADNMALLAVTALDSELGGQFDEFEIGFLNKEVFLPIQKAMNSAQYGFNQGTEILQESLSSLADKSNHRAIDAGVKKIMEQLNTGGFFGTKFSMWMRNKAGRKNNGFYTEIATRMATIIATQIDHMSNLSADEQAIDVVLLRNILGQTVEQYDGRTLKQALGNESLTDGIVDQEEILDRIAYAILTDGGSVKLSDMTPQQLYDRLTPKMKEALNSWRTHLTMQEPLVETAMLMTGRVNKFLQNYFPRMTRAQATDGTFVSSDGRNKNQTIGEILTAVNGSGTIIGVDSGQLKSRAGETGRLDLNGARILKRNLEAIHLVLNMKPVLEEIQGLSMSSEALGGIGNAMPKVFSDAVMIAVEQRLSENLSAYERAANDRFNLAYRVVAATSNVARTFLLWSGMRALKDFLSNIVKASFALSAVNKKIDISPVAAVRFGKVQKQWKRLEGVARDNGSHMHSIMGSNADNFMYEFSRNQKDVQREQIIGGWQDISVKQVAWMRRFDEAFTRLTGETFSPEDWNAERGFYRIKYADAAASAVAAADVFTERQFGSSSYVSQPLRYNLLVPFVGRLIRNVANRKGSGSATLTVSRDSSAAMIVRFMQGYQSTQFALFQSYMRQAFATKDFSMSKSANLMARALAETVIPTATYVLSGTVLGYLTATISAAANTADDDDDRDKLYKELAKMEFSERWKRKMYLVAQEQFDEDKIKAQALNAISSVTVDPAVTSGLREPIGLLTFLMWKQDAVAALKQYGGNKKKVAEAKQKIRDTETFMFGVAGIRPIEIFPTNDDYYESVRRYYKAGTETEFVGDIIRGIGAFGVFYDEANRVIDVKELMRKSDKNEKLSEKELYVAAGLKLFGYYFSQKVFTGSGAGMAANILSGDATKLGNMIISDQKTIATGIEIEENRMKKAYKAKAAKKKKKKVIHK